MRLIVTTCYSHIVYMQQQPGLWVKAIKGMTLGTPGFEYEGMAGYIETKVEFEISDISLFAKLWMSWYSEDVNTRVDLYNKLVRNYYGK